MIERAQQADDETSEVHDVVVEPEATAELAILEELAVFQASPEAPVAEEALDDTLFGRATPPSRRSSWPALAS